MKHTKKRWKIDHIKHNLKAVFWRGVYITNLQALNTHDNRGVKINNMKEQLDDLGRI